MVASHCSSKTNEPSANDVLNVQKPREMRILLVAYYEPDAQESMLRYAAWLEKMLLKRGHQVATISPVPCLSRLSRSPGISKYLGYPDKFVLFPPRLWMTAAKYDLVHVLDHSNSMYLRLLKRTPNLITCHDLLAVRAARNEFPESALGWSGKLLQRWILAGMRSARNVLCVSNTTADDLKLLAGESGALVRVVHNPLNWNYQPTPEIPVALFSRFGLKPGQAFFLHVGGNAWYKNRAGVLRIFARLSAMKQFSEARLFLVGRPFNDELRSIIRNQAMGERVIEAVNLTNEELQALYSNALALIFPSLVEGFGWPIIEAQACGCPVITSNRGPMSEVAGDAAIYIDPADPEGAAAAIAGELEYRDCLRSKGFNNVKRFDQHRIASQYCAFYADVVEKERRKRQSKNSTPRRSSQPRT